MKILIVSQYYYPYRSGLTEYIRLLAEGLAKKGHDVTVLTSRSSSEFPAKETVSNVQVVRLPVFMRIDRACVMPTLLPTLHSMSKQFDVVNIHLPFPEIYPLTLAVKSKRTVFTYHCDTIFDGALMRWVESLYYLSLRLSFKYVDAVVFNSKEYFDHSRVSNIPCRAFFIHPPIKPLKRGDPYSLRNAFGIAGEPVIGFIGRLVHEKGLEYLIESFKIVKGSIPEAKLVIAGDDKVAGGSIKKRLMELLGGHTGEILFPGPLEEEALNDFYSLCDVFVLPSIKSLESFGMVQVEAMLCGAPVVATRLPGVTVPIERTGMGILVPPRDKVALAQAIIEVLKNKEKYIVARREILKEFGLDQCIEAYESLFLSIFRSG